MSDRQNWNADDWHLFLCQHCDNRATSPNGMNTVALAIADELDRYRSQLVNVREALGELYKFWASHDDHRVDAPIMRRAREAFITSEQFAKTDEKST